MSADRRSLKPGRDNNAPGAKHLAASAFYLLIPASLFFYLLTRAIWDVDIFWELRLGEMILRAGGPVSREPFAATHLGDTLPAIGWLGQAVFAGVRLLGGWTGLQVFNAIVWLGGFWAAAAACRRRSGDPVAAVVALALGIMPALPTASIRPQSYAALGFGLLLALLRLELSPTRTFLLALPLFVLWQNLHPSVSVAAVVLGGTAAVAWMRFLLRRRPSPPWLLSALAVAAAASMFATPLGFSLVEVSVANAKASVDIGVSEWLPAWAPPNRTLAYLIATAAGLVGGVLVLKRRRIDWEELAPAVVLFVMTMAAYRFVLFWGIALIPPLVRALADEQPVRRQSLAEPFVASAMLAGAAALSLWISPIHFSESFPLQGIQRLKSAGVKGNVFAYFPWGGPVIDAGYPDWRVAYDGRYYRYTPAEWRRYDETETGAVGLAELDRIYHPTAYLLAPGINEALISALRAQPHGWRQIYADRRCVVFVRGAALVSGPASPTKHL
jgi:hypothetical protein